MKATFKIIEVINIAALMFLLLGGYGLPVTGVLQVLAAILFVTIFPKNKLIYVYFGLVVFFFTFWSGDFNWFFLLPVALIIFLTYIIYNQKIQL